MKKEDEKKFLGNIKKLYLMNIFGNAQFHLVIFTLFLLSKGLGMTQFFILASISAVTALIMEIPTGAFSDRVSRKNSMIIGTLFLILSTFLMIISNNFFVLIFAFVLGGVTMSFYSGTDKALLYDSLKAIKKQKQFKKIIGRYVFFGTISVAVAGIIGGFIAQYDLSYAWWLWFIMAFPMLLFQILLKEPPIKRHKKETYQLHLKKSFKESFKGSASYFIFYSVLIWYFFGLGFWLYQPYLQQINIPVLYFGIIYALLMVGSAIVSVKAYKIEKKIGMRNSLLIIPIILGISFILQSQMFLIIGFVFLFLQSIAGGYFSPVLEDYINTRIPTKRRATILSVKNMLGSLVFLVFSPLVGVIVDVYSLKTAYFLMGIVLLVLAIVFFTVYKKNEKKGAKKKKRK